MELSQLSQALKHLGDAIMYNKIIIHMQCHAELRRGLLITYKNVIVSNKHNRMDQYIACMDELL